MITFSKEITIGNLVTWIGFAALAYANWITYGIEQRQQRQDHNELKEKVVRMDAEGTRASQMVLRDDMALAKSNEARISVVESNWAKMVPMVEEIRVNVLWLKEGRK